MPFLSKKYRCNTLKIQTVLFQFSFYSIFILYSMELIQGRQYNAERWRSIANDPNSDPWLQEFAKEEVSRLEDAIEEHLQTA